MSAALSILSALDDDLASILKRRVGKGVVAAPALEGGGKLAPAQAKKPKQEDVEACGCKAEDPTCKCDGAMKLLVDIAKASDDEQTITGIVLKPEEVDGQGDIYSAEVIKEAAYKFLANYNRSTKLGRQHKDFKDWQNRQALVESYLAPMDFVLGTTIVKAGSWIVTFKILDPKIWKAIKDGKVTGFSIGGKAKIQKLVPDPVAQTK